MCIIPPVRRLYLYIAYIQDSFYIIKQHPFIQVAVLKYKGW